MPRRFARVDHPAAAGERVALELQAGIVDAVQVHVLLTPTLILHASDRYVYDYDIWSIFMELWDIPGINVG